MNVVLRVMMLSVLFLFSCKSNTDANFLTVATTVISFSPEQGKQVIACSSDADVEVVSSQPSWCSAKVSVWLNAVEIEVSVLKNTADARTAFLTVSAGNAEAVQIEGRQDGLESYFSIAETDALLEFNSPSSFRNISVNMNVDFTATSSAPVWCSVDVIVSEVARSLRVSVTQNENIPCRTAEISLEAPGFARIIYY